MNMVEILLNSYDCDKGGEIPIQLCGLAWQSGKTLDGWTDSVFLTLKTKNQNIN